VALLSRQPVVVPDFASLSSFLCFVVLYVPSVFCFPCQQCSCLSAVASWRCCWWRRRGRREVVRGRRCFGFSVFSSSFSCLLLVLLFFVHSTLFPGFSLCFSPLSLCFHVHHLFCFFSLSLVFSPPCILSIFFLVLTVFPLCVSLSFSPFSFFSFPPLSLFVFFSFCLCFLPPCFSFFPPVFSSLLSPLFFFYFYKARDSPVLVTADFNAFNGETSLTFYC